jgi:cobalt-zinc-cadmium resistance protein CzcA
LSSLTLDASMIRALIEASLRNPLIVLLAVAVLVGVGLYSFINVNVEAYPDPAPAIIEVIAQYPGASAEEVERLVTLPLEIALSGMPGLKYTRSKSLAGLSHLRNQFEYGIDYYQARQEVINRLQNVKGLPPGVTPDISPMTPTGELVRYTLTNPKDARGRGIYTPNDLKALQDWTLQRDFKKVPGVIDVTGFGGSVKRYEVQPDPERLQRYGITLTQLQTAIANSNANVGGDYLVQGPNAMAVRGLGLIGRGQDPVQQVLGLEVKEFDALVDGDADLSDAVKARYKAALQGAEVEPPLTAEERSAYLELRKTAGARAAVKAAAHIRAEEGRRLREIRQIVVASVNGVPVRVGELVEGGPIRSGEGDPGTRGVVVGNQTRLGQVGRVVRAPDGHWKDYEDDKVQAIVLMRKNEYSRPTLRKLNAKIDELNDHPGRLLPGVQLERHFNLTQLISVTTETVHENLILGMVLVTVVLLMFLSNVRCALIVAINVPLALLFAFSVLYLRGKSANLLSIGAVDFGIIVDSSVIMVENIFRHISAGEHPELLLRERIARATGEVQHALLFSTLIMVCAFLPLFTMSGPEGQIFGPMADTYAFALGGALLLALTLAPVMCLLLFRRLKPTRDNFLVRRLRASYLRQLDRCLRFRWVTLGIMGALFAFTLCLLPGLGHEFMPELEEGNLWVRGTFPVNISLEEAANKTRIARSIMRDFPEVEMVASQNGRPDDGTDPTGFYNAEFHVPLKPEKEWPARKQQQGWRGWFRTLRPRTKAEVRDDMKAELGRIIPGVDWNFSQYVRDNVTEALSGVKGDNSVKIIGSDLNKLEKLAEQVKAEMERVPGITELGIFHALGQPNLELPVDRAKCERWGINVADVQAAVKSAVGGQAFTQMVEGEKTFDLTLRWPAPLRNNLSAILHIPVDVTNNIVTASYVASRGTTTQTGGSVGVSASGSAQESASTTGSKFSATFNDPTTTPRRRLGDLVTPLNDQGRPDPNGSFVRSGASTIYREQGNRLIAVKFSVRGRDLAGAVKEAQQKTAHLFKAPYRAEWSGEFEELEAAEGKLMWIIPLSLGLICMLLFLAFNSVLDTLVVLSNVLALSMGGVWALRLTGTNFSISAAVGFISIFGVAVMDGLLSISYFNSLRAQGVPLPEAIRAGASKRVRPMMMTALTAIFGLLPAALSTRIGSQTQRPLAIVVVGGMIMALLLNRYLMPVLYSFYGHREPPAGSGGMAH